MESKMRPQAKCCQYCDHRHVHCHGDCKEYEAYLDELRIWKEKYKKEHEEEWIYNAYVRGMYKAARK